MAAKKSSKSSKSQGRLDLHRRQLFHWIGGNLESGSGLNANQKAEKYVEYLKGSLKNGLWMKVPRENDELGKDGQFQVQSPICCFTETALNEINFHNREYGKLGLGFPKRFVLSHGGRPVNYINDVAGDPTFVAWKSLRRILTHPKVNEVLTNRESEELQEEFEYLCQFLKRIKLPREKPERKPSKKKDDTVISRNPKPSFKRSYGNILHYLEEREWRIVLKNSRKRTWPNSVKKNADDAMPEWFLPYQSGNELFTIVFPNNLTLAKAMECDFIREKVFPKEKPPVTLLSLDEIDTF